MRSSTLDFQDKVPYLAAILQDSDTGLRRTEFIYGYKDGMDIHIGDRVYATVNEHGEEIFSLA
jgi:hypothetical protein